jgi:hypothetical protein
VDPGDLSTQHGVLVAQDQQFGILTQISTHQHDGQMEQSAHHLIQDSSSIRRSSMTDRNTRTAGRTLHRVFEPHTPVGHQPDLG